MDAPVPAKEGVDREKTCPFLLRAFVKINGFHGVVPFEDGQLPVQDEHQIYTWKDATLRELVTYLRSLTPGALSLTLRHPSARFSFRLIFPDAHNRGRMATKDLGSVYAKDVISASKTTPPADAEPTMDVDTAPKTAAASDTERTLDELRVVPGDWLLVAVHVPPKAMGMTIAGAAASVSPTNARGGGPPIRGGAVGLRGQSDFAWGARGRGDGGHWRGGSRGGPPPPPPSGRGGRDAGPPRRPSPSGRDRDRRPSPVGRDRDRRPSPSGRDRDRDRDRYRSRSRSPSRSRSRSPPRRSRRD